MQHINYCSHAEQLTFNCHKREGGGRGTYYGTVFYLSYSDAVSFRDIRGHLGTIPSIVTFYGTALTTILPILFLYLTTVTVTAGTFEP